MQTFRYRHNSGFQPFSRRFLASIKFQMPVVPQRSRIRIVYWWHIQKQPFTREGDRNWVHITFFQGRLLRGGGGGCIGHMPSKFETWLKLTNCSPLILSEEHRPYAIQVWNMTQTDKLQPFHFHTFRRTGGGGGGGGGIGHMLRNGHKCTIH